MEDRFKLNKALLDLIETHGEDEVVEALEDLLNADEDEGEDEDA